MRTTVYQEKRTLRVKNREINLIGEYDWQYESLRQALHDQFQLPSKPYKLELNVNNKFIIEVEPDKINDETDGFVIERFDELKLNFGELARVKIIAITR